MDNLGRCTTFMGFFPHTGSHVPGNATSVHKAFWEFSFTTAYWSHHLKPLCLENNLDGLMTLNSPQQTGQPTLRGRTQNVRVEPSGRAKRGE